jgi:hypothetical protein
MRALVAALTVAVAGMTLEVRAADGTPPPRADRKAQPAYRGAPPRVHLVPVERPAGIAIDPAGWAYAMPAPVYRPGDEYFQVPALVDGTRYYRECWWEWGFYRCALKPRWFR